MPAGAFWDVLYAVNVAPWDSGEVPPEVRQLIGGSGIKKPRRALDIGCGTGTNVKYLAEQGVDVVGVDISRLAVRRARARLASAGLVATCVTYDATRLHEPGSPVGGQFDYILDIGCFHGLGVAGRQRYADMVRQLLAPGGVLHQYIHMSGGVSVSGSGKRRIPLWKQAILAVARTVMRRSPPQRPDLPTVKRSLCEGLDLLTVVEGEDAGRPSAWLLWQRAANSSAGRRSSGVA